MTTWLTLLLTTLAVDRAQRALTEERVGQPLRTWVLARYGNPISGTQSAPVELVNCGKCVSFWLAGLSALALSAAGAVSWRRVPLTWAGVAGAAGLLARLP